MALYQSSIGDQLARAERQIRAYIRRMLLEFGRRFRARMMRERIGGNGSVLKVKTGKLKRSFRYQLVETAGGLRIEAQVGGGAAPYAEDHEELSRLEFQNTFQQEADKVLAEIQVGLEFFARNPGVEASAGVGDAGAEGVQTSANFGIRAIGEHFRLKKAIARERRQLKWRSMGRAA